MTITDHDPTQSAPLNGGATAPRPVVLATLSARIEPDAERVAIESALDSGAQLIVVNLVRLPLYPTTLVLAREYATLPHEEDLEAVRATAVRAAAHGVTTQLLRIRSSRPLAALIELLVAREAGLVVLGADPRHSPWWWRKLAARRIRRSAPCLVWLGAAQTSALPAQLPVDSSRIVPKRPV